MSSETEMTDAMMINHALNMWANYIETGNVSLSAIDCQNQKKPFKALAEHQMEYVLRLRKLARKQFEGKASRFLENRGQ